MVYGYTPFYDEYIDKCHELDRVKALKRGGSIGVIIFLLNFTFFIAILYGKKLIADGLESEDGKGEITAGDVMTVIFSTLIAIMSLGAISLNLKIIQVVSSFGWMIQWLYYCKLFMKNKKMNYG